MRRRSDDDPVRQVKPFFWPPTLILRQAVSALCYGGVVGWRHMPAWFVRHGFRSPPVRSGWAVSAFPPTRSGR